MSDLTADEIVELTTAPDDLPERVRDELDEIGFILWNGKWPSEINDRAVASHLAAIMELRYRSFARSATE